VKKILGVVVGLVVVLAVAVVVLPGIIDWNDYKGTIQRQLKGLTGRDVVIAGDIHIAVLPAPAVVAHGVRMANVEGANAADMVRLKSVEVRVSLGPLLTGHVEVQTVKLVDPVIELERLADGRVNWQFNSVRTERDGSASAPLPGVAVDESDGAMAAIRLDNFHIENGLIIYRDARSGWVERISGIDAKLSAESLSGPFDSIGRLNFRGIPLGYEASVGRVINEQTVPLNMVVTGEPGDVRVDVSGAIVELAEAPKFRGKIAANGKMLSHLMTAVGDGGVPPTFFARPFEASGDVTVSAQELSVKHLSIALGALRAEGELAANLAERPISFSTRLIVPKVDLDALLASSPAEPAAAQANRPAAPAPSAATAAVATPDVVVPTETAFGLPRNVNGTIELTAETISYRGNIISDARAIADLHGGEIILNQLAAQLPGGSDLFMTGILSAHDSEPKFDGTLDAKISDLRRIVAWLGGGMPGIASDRLRNATVRGRIVADSRQVQGLNLDMVLDSSRITGGITLALRQRLAFGASFTVDRLNLDGYLAPNGAPSPAGTSGRQPQPTDGADVARSKDSFGFPDFLNRFDANLRLQVDRLTYRQIPIGGVIFNGTLFGGTVDVRKAAVGDLAGASAALSGTLTGLNLLPSIKNGRVDARGIDIDRLARVLEIPVPVSTRDLGLVDITGSIEGSLLRPLVDLQAKTPEATVDLKGRLSALSIGSLFEGDIKATHADFPRMLRLFGIEYRPVERLGEFGLSVAVKTDARKVSLSQFDAKVGSAAITGALDIDLADARPRLTGQIRTGRIVVDPFLPARRSASLVPRVIPAAWVPSRVSGDGIQVWQTSTGSDRWSTQPIDLSALAAFDADLKLSGEAVVYDNLTVSDMTADATVADGVLRIPSLTGTLFGGALSGNATLASAPKPAVEATLSLTGGDFGIAQQEMKGKRLATGDVAFKTAINSVGASFAELISGLQGDGSFEVRKAAVTGESGNSSRGPIAELLAGINQLAGIVVGGGGQRPEGLADISGSFKIDRGIARSEDLSLISTVGEGKGKGALDLPKWTMKVEGDIQLSQNLFSKLLSGTTGLNLTLPLRIEGDVDHPNVVLDVAKLPGKALSIPGTLIDKSGVGKILRKLIPETAN